MKQDKKQTTYSKMGIIRRGFLIISILLGVLIGITACNSTSSEENKDSINTSEQVYKTDFQPIEVNSPMAKWKKPQSLEFVTEATKNYSFPNWQSGNDQSVYYNMNLAAFFKSQVIPTPETAPSLIERDINRDLLDLTFTDHEGITTPKLKEYLIGPKQVQAMIMVHKGKIVFETYPGMNPTGYHVWMSASKTVVGLLACMLWEDGKLDFEKPISTYVPDLKGTAWDNASVKDVMNMSSGLDIEETFENLMNPESFISHFFSYSFGSAPGDWQKLTQEAQPLKNEKPGDHFRYSSANTQVLVLMIQNITGMLYQDVVNERVWSKIGPKYPFLIGLAPDGTPIGAGMNNTTPEDMVRYALLYTPSWNVVAKEQVISDKLLKKIQTLGNPSAYKNSTEEEYGTKWFGHTPDLNTAQWDHAFNDGAMFKHGNMGQGIYVDPERDFCGIYFGLASNDESVSGIDHSPGYLRAAAKQLAGK